MADLHQCHPQLRQFDQFSLRHLLPRHATLAAHSRHCLNPICTIQGYCQIGGRHNLAQHVDRSLSVQLLTGDTTATPPTFQHRRATRPLKLTEASTNQPTRSTTQPSQRHPTLVALLGMGQDYHHRGEPQMHPTRQRFRTTTDRRPCHRSRRRIHKATVHRRFSRKHHFSISSRRMILFHEDKFNNSCVRIS